MKTDLRSKAQKIFIEAPLSKQVMVFSDNDLLSQEAKKSVDTFLKTTRKEVSLNNFILYYFFLLII